MENCKEKFSIFLPSQNEKQKMLLVGAEAITLGYEGIKYRSNIRPSRESFSPSRTSGHFVTTTKPRAEYKILYTERIVFVSLWFVEACLTRL